MKTSKILTLLLALGSLTAISLKADFLKLRDIEMDSGKQKTLSSGKVPAGEEMKYLKKLEEIFSGYPVWNMGDEGYYTFIEVDDKTALSLQCKMVGPNATCSITRMGINDATDQVETLRPLSSAGPSAGSRPSSSKPAVSPLATQSSSSSQ